MCDLEPACVVVRWSKISATNPCTQFVSSLLLISFSHWHSGADPTLRGRSRILEDFREEGSFSGLSASMRNHAGGWGHASQKIFEKWPFLRLEMQIIYWAFQHLFSYYSHACHFNTWYMWSVSLTNDELDSPVTLQSASRLPTYVSLGTREQ